MNITKISANMNTAFIAQTKITAPETLLSSEERKYFEELGKQYKTSDDFIEISITDLHASANKPNVQIYTVSKTIKGNSANGNYTDESQMSVPYIKDGIVIEKNSPKNYLTKLFNGLLSK